MLVLHYRAIPELRRHVEQLKANAPPTAAPHWPPSRPHPRLAAPVSSAGQTTKCGWCRQITGRRRPTPGVGTSGR